MTHLDYWRFEHDTSSSYEEIPEENVEMITYKAPGMEIKMERAIAEEFIERLVDEHLFSNPIEDWIFAWGTELGILKED